MKVGETWCFRDCVFLLVEEESVQSGLCCGWVGLILDGTWPPTGAEGNKIPPGGTFTFAKRSTVVAESVRFPAEE